MTSPIDQLIEIFRRFPGIGPKQAKRFVYYLLSRPEADLKKLANLIARLHQEINECEVCHRYFPKNNGPVSTCNICSDPNLDQSTLLIVEKDIDLDNIRRSGIYAGGYFVLGGLIPILDERPEERIRLKILRKKIESDFKKDILREIIIALSANSEGDNTAEYLGAAFHDLRAAGLKISLLGRGLSTGTELEYSDAETIKSAMISRHQI